MKVLTFDELIKLLKSKDACADQLKPILKDGTLDFAYKVMRGNRNWVRQHFGTDFDDILNDGEALTFRSDRQLRERWNFKSGRIEGLYECWHSGGQLWRSCNYANDIPIEESPRT